MQGNHKGLPLSRCRPIPNTLRQRGELFKILRSVSPCNAGLQQIFCIILRNNAVDHNGRSLSRVDGAGSVH